MNEMVDKEQESQDITVYKKQLIQWRSLLKHLPKTDKDRDEVGEIDQLISVLKAELAKAQPVLDAAMEYAKTPAGVSRESLRAKSLAADRMFKAARAMEE